MANLIPLDQAAAMLGMTAEKLTEMRSNNEIFGYRDGQNWKFKMTEIERVAADLGITLNTADAFDADMEFELSDDSLELSDDLSGSSDSGSIDILADSAEFTLEESGEIQLSGGSDVLASDEKVTDEEELSFGSSSISLAAGSSKKLGPNDTGDLLDESPSSSGAASDTGKLLAAGSNMAEDDLFDDDLELAEDSFEESAELSSDFEDSDLVLDDSDSSNEIGLAADSGINLSANDSGIELDDEPLELGGSDIDALELPEDDVDLIELDDAADQDAATLMAQEDEFKLTALEEDLDDQSSGSQVIALEDSEIYTDESEATILADSDDLASQPAMLPASDASGLVETPAAASSVFDQAGMMSPGGAGMVAPAAAPTLPEAPYSLWNVLGLGVVATLLILGGIVGFDVARNLWMPEDQIISSGLLKFFLDITGMS